MFQFTWRPATAIAGAALLVGLACASAQAESVRSQCSDQYNAKQKANTLGGQSWSQFYKGCKAQMKAEKKEEKAEKKERKAAPAAIPAAAPAAPPPAPARTTAKTTGPAPVATGPIVYPRAISPQYASLSAGRARLKTCDDQYKANKATNSNGGLRWIEKGGGYWSLCNKHLKGE